MLYEVITGSNIQSGIDKANGSIEDMAAEATKAAGRDQGVVV